MYLNEIRMGKCRCTEMNQHTRYAPHAFAAPPLAESRRWVALPSFRAACPAAAAAALPFDAAAALTLRTRTRWPTLLAPSSLLRRKSHIWYAVGEQ